MNEPPPDLGPCCICKTTHNVRNIILLDLKTPLPGRGWGCFLCHLPADGASAVLCDPCHSAYAAGTANLRFACRGYPATDGRVPFATLSSQFQHDETLHLELH